MTLKNKILTYLGFCPTKASAQRFTVRDPTITTKQSIFGVGFILFIVLLVNPNNLYSLPVTLDMILKVFSFTVFTIIVVLCAGGTVVSLAGEFARDPWALGKNLFAGNFMSILIWGATSGFFFISPTDGWAEIIIESLAASLAATVLMVMVARTYSSWRKDKQ